MSTPGSPPAAEGMYSKLIDDEGALRWLGRAPDVGLGGPRVRLATRLSSAGPHRLITICLAALCAVLLVAIIAVTAHNRNKPADQPGEEVTAQKQAQEANMTALTATISKLQQEKEQLQQEKEQLQQEKEQLQKEKEQLQKEKEQLQQKKEQLQQEKEQLQKEKEQLQKEKEQLQQEQAATKAPEVVRPVTKPAPAPVTCPGNWNLFGGSCYFISAVSNDWPDSQAFCQTHGAHLAIILTAEEQTFLWNLLPRGYWNAYWFGITDEHTEDHWKWVDGTPLVGGFWEVGEPNNHIDEDCGYMVKTQVLERVAIRSWYDAPCTMYRLFICEKEMNAGGATAH